VSSPPQLGFDARELTTTEFRALRAAAFAAGTVVERDGFSVLASGSAFSIDLPRGLADREALAAAGAQLRRVVPRNEHSGSLLPGGVLAIGAFAFLPEAETHLLVPRLLVLCRGDRFLAIAVGVALEDAISEALGKALLADQEPPPDSFRLESCRPHADFLEKVAAAVDEIRRGRLEKVVMAREVRVEANRPLRQADLLERLRALHPSCAAFAVKGFIGASPELLVRRRGTEIESHPLAGTSARSGDPEADRLAEQALLESEKERAEHRAVVDAIAEGLAPVVAELDVPALPSIVELRNVCHLGTHIKGRLRDVEGATPSALEVLALIHPTPAVSGTPIDMAIDYLAKAEDLDRDRYAGALGWMDAAGDGEWHLGIRCAIVEDRTARLFAGVGVVADSDPAAELAETQLKLQAFLAAAVRP
jgi:menaquinone-specific isochorismate synthase